MWYSWLRCRHTTFTFSVEIMPAYFSEKLVRYYLTSWSRNAEDHNLKKRCYFNRGYVTNSPAEGWALYGLRVNLSTLSRDVIAILIAGWRRIVPKFCANPEIIISLGINILINMLTFMCFCVYDFVQINPICGAAVEYGRSHAITWQCARHSSSWQKAV